ncbi:MAG: thiopurine S-methyltransferase [Candidatus Competibacteraceae bacterium]
MEPDFWHRRWRKNEIAFHQQDINTHLQQFWSRLTVKPNERIFVPLCGKSLDMLWLAGQGHPVLGVEINRLAVESFFQENDVNPQIRRTERFEVWQADAFTLLLGDFFALVPADLSDIASVYDRASLIALPPAIRQQYARHLTAILPPSAGVLLVTLEYPQEAMQGPPFSVEESEVQALYGNAYAIERLYVHDALAENPRFHDRLDRLEEKVYLLKPKAARGDSS